MPSILYNNEYYRILKLLYEVWPNDTDFSPFQISLYAGIMFKVIEYIILENKFGEFVEYISKKFENDLLGENKGKLYAETKANFDFLVGKFKRAISMLEELMKPDGDMQDFGRNFQEWFGTRFTYKKQNGDTEECLTSTVLYEVFFTILTNFRKSNSDKLDKSIMHDGKPRKEYMQTITIRDIDYSADSDITRDKVLTFDLANLLGAPVTIIKPEYCILNSKLTSVIVSSKPLNEFLTDSWLQGKNRSFVFIFETSQWFMCYEKMPFSKPYLRLNEMIVPMKCHYCMKNITTCESDNEDRLFIPENCIYRHKYHLKCFTKLLDAYQDNLYSDKTHAVNSYFDRIKNFYKPQFACFGCGWKITMKDMKALYPRKFITEIQVQINTESRDDKEYKICGNETQGKMKVLLNIKEYLRKTSPFAKSVAGGLKAAECTRCTGKPHQFSLPLIKKIIGEDTKSSFYLLYCSHCGVLLNEDKLLLTCGHNICHTCGYEWIIFTAGKSKGELYKEKNSIHVIWPFIECAFCKDRFDICGIQVHGNHYMSIQHILREYFINGNKLEKCVEKDCTSTKSMLFGKILRPVIEGLEVSTKTNGEPFIKFEGNMTEIKVKAPEEEKKEPPPPLEEKKAAEINKEEVIEKIKIVNNCSLLDIRNLDSYDTKKIEENIDILQMWMSLLFCVLRVDKNNRWYLIGYRNSLNNATELLKDIDKNILQKVNKYRECFKKIKPVDAERIKKIKISGINNCEVRELWSYDHFIKASIFVNISGDYCIDSQDIFYLCLNGADLKEINRIGADISPLLKVIGPFGRGFYLSRDPVIIYQMSTLVSGKYYMAAVNFVEDRSEKNNFPVLNPLEPNRCSALFQYPISNNTEKYKNEQSKDLYNTTRIGNYLKIRILGVPEPLMVCFDPSQIIVRALVSYEYDFTKMKYA